MSRSGYVDDFEDSLVLGRWRGRVASAIRGKRGQALLREMRDALDAMPEKRLIAGDLVNDDGECCALGCVGMARGIENLKAIDPEDYDQVASAFDIAAPLACEIAYFNDEWCNETPEARWKFMRDWVEKRIKPEAGSPKR